MAMSFEFVSGSLPRKPKRTPKHLRLPETKEEMELLKKDVRLYRQYCEKLKKHCEKDVSNSLSKKL